MPSFKVEVVDTTGAGDVFHGGYIFGILKGLSLKDTIQFASALAALKCAKVGGRVGIPNLNETITFLEQNSLSEIVSGLRKS
ncbi:MAG TPA: carbohydrate kinase [Nitrospina sp.]|nr:carbohydrate kinase [Nitrospina sp.]